MKTTDFPKLLAMFFANYLVQQRQASPHTVASYRTPSDCLFDTPSGS